MHGMLINSLDPAYNLALEQTLFESLTPHSPGYFLLWHNGPSIIVGRHQNTVQELNEALVQRYGLAVVRRLTGGGAVYHDAGNLNFSFLQPCTGAEQGRALDFAPFLNPIVAALASLGVQAEFSSRNDLTVGARKVSGSAQLRRPQGILHHGTLLVDLDLDMLGAVLTGAPDKYLSKGVASVRSRVRNLSEVLPQGQGMAEIKAALMAHCASEVMEVPPEAHWAAEALAQSRYRSWDWNYGASPAFTSSRRQRFPWGAVECCLTVRRGVIVQCRIFGDFFAAREVAELEARLTGLRHTADALHEALASPDGVDDPAWGQYFAGCEPLVMRDFFCCV